MAVGPQNRRLLAIESVLTPATAVGVAVGEHYWGHHPWLTTIVGGIMVALVTGATRWYVYRR